MLPPSSSGPSANSDSALGTPESAHDRARATPARFLVDAPAAAAALAISERTFHTLRKRADFPRNATVVVGPRCVRFRLDALHTFAMSLVSTPQSEPRQLRESRKIRSERRPDVEVETLLECPDAKPAAKANAQRNE